MPGYIKPHIEPKSVFKKITFYKLNFCSLPGKKTLSSRNYGSLIMQCRAMPQGLPVMSDMHLVPDNFA